MLFIHTDDIKKWKFLDLSKEEFKIEFVKTIYNFCIISMRNKGMPKNKLKLELAKPWIYNDNKKQKRSIHVSHCEMCTTAKPIG